MIRNTDVSRQRCTQATLCRTFRRCWETHEMKGTWHPQSSVQVTHSLTLATAGSPAPWAQCMWTLLRAHLFPTNGSSLTTALRWRADPLDTSHMNSKSFLWCQKAFFRRGRQEDNDFYISFLHNICSLLPGQSAFYFLTCKVRKCVFLTGTLNITQMLIRKCRC